MAFLPAAVAAPGGEVSVPGFFSAAHSATPLSLLLHPVKCAAPAIETPAAAGVRPQEGDDTSAPNAVALKRLNHIVCFAKAAAGYSTSPPDAEVPPVRVAHDLRVDRDGNSLSLTVETTLEYENAFGRGAKLEGMVLRLKKAKQWINDECTAELVLIDTRFEDLVDAAWVPIPTEVRYTEEADAVVHAVTTTDSGQTAGRTKVEGAAEDVKLGPVGSRGRVVLTYRCAELYSYAEQTLSPAAPQRQLAPIAVQIPHSCLDSPASHCEVSVRVRGPGGAALLDPAAGGVLALKDLQHALITRPSGLPSPPPPRVVLPAPDGAGGWAFRCAALPPVPVMVLCWLAVGAPPADDDYVDVGAPQGGGRVTLQIRADGGRVAVRRPTPADEALLGVALPGGGAQLYRCEVHTKPAPRAPGLTRVHTDIQISDASGSTGMRRGGGGETTRQLLNMHATRRLLRRLRAIPSLVEAGVFLPQDRWVQEFVVFDGGVRAHFSIESSVGDLTPPAVDAIAKAAEAGPGAAAWSAVPGVAAAQAKQWQEGFRQLQGLTPGGVTSFVAGARKAREAYVARRAGPPGAARTAYVNFDTDGGNNCGACYEAVQAMVRDCDVVTGWVLGVGAWLDQDCATKVGQHLKGGCSLAMDFPQNEAEDTVLRADLSRWVRTLRSQPVSLVVGAGAVSWNARQGARAENAVDTLFASGDNVGFDTVNVQDATHTRAVVKGAQAGETVRLYIISRLPYDQLCARLRVEYAGNVCSVDRGEETLSGPALGHHWLAALAGRGAGRLARHHASLPDRLRQRLEDDVSMAWNMPSLSGSTSAVGRAATAQRPPVPEAQQPAAPDLPEQPMPVQPDFGGPFAGGFGGGFGGGGGGFAVPAGIMYSGSMPVHRPAAAGRRSPPGAPPMPSYGLADGCAAPACAAPPPPPSAPPRCAPVASLRASAPMAGGKGAPMAGGKGAPMADRARRRGGKGGKGRGGAPRRSGWSGDSDDETPGANGPQPWKPSQILEASGQLRAGPPEPPPPARSGKWSQDLFARACGQVTHLLQSQETPPAAAARSAVEAGEDPLVTAMFGGSPPPAGGGGGGAEHRGFVCDGTSVNPIVGRRFRSVVKQDYDLCEAARQQPRAARDGGGYMVVPDEAAALRVPLRVLLVWWAAILDAPPELPADLQAADIDSMAAPQLVAALKRFPPLV